MAKQIRQVGHFKADLTGKELVEIQEPLGGLGSSNRTSIEEIGRLVAGQIPSPQVLSVQGRYGDVVVEREDLNLENVDNTRDIDKPVSTAQQEALDKKANIEGQIFTGTVDAPTLLEGGIQVVTVETFDGNFDDRLNEVLSSTTQLPEGENLYHTNERVDARIRVVLPDTDALKEGQENLYLTGAGLNARIDVASGIYKQYDAATGKLRLVGPGTFPEPAVVMVNNQQGVVELTTDDIPEGVANRYYPETSPGRIGAVFDGSGREITTPYQVQTVVPFDCTIQSYSLLADTEGVVELDIRVSSWGSPAEPEDSIVGEAPPMLTLQQYRLEYDLADWNVLLTKGQVITFIVQSCEDIAQLNIVLEVEKING